MSHVNATGGRRIVDALDDVGLNVGKLRRQTGFHNGGFNREEATKPAFGQR